MGETRVVIPNKEDASLDCLLLKVRFDFIRGSASAIGYHEVGHRSQADYRDCVG